MRCLLRSDVESDLRRGGGSYPLGLGSDTVLETHEREPDGLSSILCAGFGYRSSHMYGVGYALGQKTLSGRLFFSSKSLFSAMMPVDLQSTPAFQSTPEWLSMSPSGRSS